MRHVEMKMNDVTGIYTAHLSEVSGTNTENDNETIERVAMPGIMVGRRRNRRTRTCPSLAVTGG